MTTDATLVGHRHTPACRNAVNRAVITLLRSPAHPLADSSLCELRYLGPKSGRPVSLPVGYAALDRDYVVVAGDACSKRWWRAFRTRQPVDVWAGAHVRRAVGRVLTPADPRFEEAAAAYERRHGVAVTADDRVVLIEFGAEGTR